MFVELPQPSEKHSLRLCETLLDLGASSSVVNSWVVHHLQWKQSKITSFTTVAGQFNCKETRRTQIKMPELKTLAVVEVTLHVTQMNGNYDMILGRDFLTQLGIVLDFEQQIVRRGNNLSK